MHCQPCLFHFQKAISFISNGRVTLSFLKFEAKEKNYFKSPWDGNDFCLISTLKRYQQKQHRVALEKFVSVIVPFMPVNALMDWTVEVTHVKNGIDFPLLMEKSRIKSHNNKFFCLIFCFVTIFGWWMEKWRVARCFRDRKLMNLSRDKHFRSESTWKGNCWSHKPLHVTPFWCELLIASK